MADALSKTEKAYAEVKSALNFRERRMSVNQANSASPDIQATPLNISQGQPGSIQDTPTPDATVSALQKNQLEPQVQQLETQPSWFEKYVVPLSYPCCWFRHSNCWYLAI